MRLNFRFSILFSASFSLTSVVRKVNLYHFSCIHQWKTILGTSFKIILNVIIWFQVSKTLITFEGRCLNDIPWSYIQFVLLRQQPRKTFTDRNTMYSLIWYAMNIISKGNSNLLEKRLIFFCHWHSRSITIFTFLIWHRLCSPEIKSPVDITYQA